MIINENYDDADYDDGTDDIISKTDRHTDTHRERSRLTNLDESSSGLINASTDFCNSSWQTGFSQ